MIGRVPDPSHVPADGEPQRVLYVPLVSRRHVWRPINPPLGGRDDLFAAAQVCALNTRTAYQRLLFQVRTLLALCTRPEFHFEAEIIDSDLIREHVAQVHATSLACWPNIDKLLDEPDRGDRIRIRGQRMRLNGDGVLVVDDGAASKPELLPASAEDDEPITWAKLSVLSLADLISAVLSSLERTRGETLSLDEIDTAIVCLQELRATRSGSNTAPADEPTEPAVSPEPAEPEPAGPDKEVAEQ